MTAKSAQARSRPANKRPATARSRIRISALLSLILGFGGGLAVAQPAEAPTPKSAEVIRIWPGAPPGTADWSGAETAQDAFVPDAGRKVHIIGNVTAPTLTVIRPPPGRASGAGVVILPGGAWGALAWDLEGVEVARWLADRGITAFILKYRVRGADPATAAQLQTAMSKPGANAFDELMNLLTPRRRIATDDAIQALRVVRSNAAKFGVDPQRIGMIGFSAGAMTTMSAVLESDAATRPNFAASIYGAIASDAGAPTSGDPPVFIAAASDDHTVPVGQSVAIFQAWRSSGLPAELHIYESGGHGFGLGKPGTASAAWPAAFSAWLSLHKLVAPADARPVGK